MANPQFARGLFDNGQEQQIEHVRTISYVAVMGTASARFLVLAPQNGSGIQGEMPRIKDVNLSLRNVAMVCLGLRQLKR